MPGEIRHSIRDVPKAADLVGFRAGFGQRYLVTVDVEEEFDWSKPLAKEGHSLETVAQLETFQKFCADWRVKPAYLVDYPVATDPQATAMLRQLHDGKLIDIGIQLHPWVNPPMVEEVNRYNSFAGNLDRSLEEQKLAALVSAIRNNIGATPLIYRAGRYGAGPHTAQLLASHGVRIDSSVRAKFDYSAEGGPNYRRHPLFPWWVDRASGLMELPLTTVFWGPLRKQGDAIYPQLWRAPRMRGLLSRIGLLERISLTPEGISVDEAMKAIDIALDEGLPVLNFSFHSPSLSPGHTPYVRNQHDLDQFYDWWRRVFDYLALRGVAPASVDQIIAAASN